MPGPWDATYGLREQFIRTLSEDAATRVETVMVVNVSMTQAAAEWFADYDNFGSHSRGIGTQRIEEARLDLRVTLLVKTSSMVTIF